MDKFQSGIAAISFAALAIYIFISLVGVEKFSKWIKWYWQMNVEEQKKYDPRIAMRRIKKNLAVIFAVGISGFLLSLVTYPVIAIVTFGLIVVLLIFFIVYTGPKECLIEEN